MAEELDVVVAAVVGAGVTETVLPADVVLPNRSRTLNQTHSTIT